MLLCEHMGLGKKLGRVKPWNIRVTFDHMMVGTGYPDAMQGKIASEPTVTSFASGCAAIWGKATKCICFRIQLHPKHFPLILCTAIWDSIFRRPWAWCLFYTIQIKTNGKRNIINILDIIMYSHWILRTTWECSEPTLLVAVQRYCPESESVTWSILRMFPLISTWAGSEPPTLLQRTVGSGSPIAWHSNSTELPTITVCTDVRTLIFTLGRAVKTKSTVSGFLKSS